MENVLLAETELTFSYFAAFGAFANNDLSPGYSLEAGTKYVVKWDGQEYTRTAFAFTAADGAQCVGVGNPIAMGAESNGDSFCVVYDSTNNIVHYLSLSQDATHTVAIYAADESTGDDTPGTDTDETYNTNDAIILSYSQNPDLYKNIPKVWLTHPSSTEDAPVLVPFTYGEAVSKEVEPDFSGGDMAVEIAEGELVTGLTIVKPETLIPENIASGITIAGVEGTFSGGGSDFDLSDENLKFFYYQIDSENRIFLITGICYEAIYNATGSYDVTVPDKIGGYSVVLVST